MSGIVLSASVRQNLLSLQSTAALLATTQNDLATGNKVNSALDNPTEYFTAQGLNNRASDINNLLDGIGNGVQVLQAANTGITSLQSLVASAQSIANQVLQSPVGYTTKSNVTSNAITGATGTNLLESSSTASAGSALANNNSASAVAVTGATLLSGTATTSSNDLASAFTTTDTLIVNGVTFTFAAGSTSSGTTIGIGDTVTDLISTIDSAAGVTTTLAAGALTVTPGTAGLTLAGTALAKLGLSSVGDGLAGQTLSIAATGGGTATAITFGLGTGQVSTLDQLNTALAANNLQATINSSTGALNIVTSNNAASSTIGAITGSSTTLTGGAFKSVTAPAAPVADPNSQATRAGLVAQYNNVLQQINTTSEDSSLCAERFEKSLLRAVSFSI
jgi:flagellin